MQRRTFMSSMGMAAFPGAVGMEAETAQEGVSRGRDRRKPPNILMIMPDQMRGDALSLERHPVLITPNMDSLGAKGARMARAYTTCASCIPARRSLLTGLYPASNGLVGYQEGIALDFPTLPQLLRDGGYATALIGRYMHQSPYSHSFGYEKQVLGSSYIEDDDYARMLEAEMPRLGGIRGLGATFNGWTARPWPYPEYLHPTNWTVHESRQTIREAAPDKPLFLTTSFYAPHPPLLPPPVYYERYKGMALPDPAIGSWAVPPPNDGLGLGVDSDRCVLRGEALRAAQAGYFGLINQIDDQLYWLIAEFQQKSRQMERPWVILLTSDHGEMLGDHYYFRKCEPYEGSSRVPLLFQGSSDLGWKPGVLSSQPVCLEDIMPTLLDLAGIPAPERMDGRSLVPVLRGEDVTLRPWLHGEHAPAYSPDQAYHFLTDGHGKYVWRPQSGQEQLFDLDQDPRELRDLAREKPGVLREWRSRLIGRLAGRPEGFTDGRQLIAGRPYRNALPGTRTVPVR